MGALLGFPTALEGQRRVGHGLVNLGTDRVLDLDATVEQRYVQGRLPGAGGHARLGGGVEGGLHGVQGGSGFGEAIFHGSPPRDSRYKLGGWRQASSYACACGIPLAMFAGVIMSSAVVAVSIFITGVSGGAASFRTDRKS